MEKEMGFVVYRQNPKQYDCESESSQLLESEKHMEPRKTK